MQAHVAMIALPSLPPSAATATRLFSAKAAHTRALATHRQGATVMAVALPRVFQSAGIQNDACTIQMTRSGTVAILASTPLPAN